jgi:hypothetical protein
MMRMQMHFNSAAVFAACVVIACPIEPAAQFQPAEVALTPVGKWNAPPLQ